MFMYWRMMCMRSTNILLTFLYYSNLVVEAGAAAPVQAAISDEKKSAIHRIENERAAAFAVLQTDYGIVSHTGQPSADDDHRAGNQLEACGENVTAIPEALVQMAADVMSDDDMEVGQSVEEGELVQFWATGEDAGVFEETSDFDTEVHTDKESDSGSGEEDSLCHFLTKWNKRHNITREAMKDLVVGLRDRGHPELPMDPRTLLRTSIVYSVENKCGGCYVYLSLAKSLKSAISKIPNIQIGNNTELHLQFNIDGIPMFNSGSQSLWPILSRVVSPLISTVFVIALYAGRKNQMILMNSCNLLFTK